MPRARANRLRYRTALQIVAQANRVTTEICQKPDTVTNRGEKY